MTLIPAQLDEELMIRLTGLISGILLALPPGQQVNRLHGLFDELLEFLGPYCREKEWQAMAMIVRRTNEEWEE